MELVAVADDYLQRFLNSRLFDVGGDDERLKLLRLAANELADTLKASPERIPAFTMVAIDSETPPDEPLLAEVGGILQHHWNSYAGAFADRTLPVVFRGIILNALGSMINSDPVATAVTMTGRNLLPRLGARADEGLWRDLVDTASHRLEMRARREWALPSAAAAQQHELKVVGIGTVAGTNASKEWLTKQLRAAVGPHTPEQEATGGNAYWPNSGEAWAHDFAARAAAAIVGSINGTAKTLVENVNKELGFKDQAEAIGAYVQAVAGSVAQTALGLERRTSLLWWKEALYSPAAAISYRQLDLPVAAALAAVDSAEQIGAFAPRMAEAFLAETVRSIDPVAAGERMQLVDLCCAVEAAPAEVREILLARLGQLHVEPGRTQLASLIGTGVTIDGAILERRVGLDPAEQMSIVDFALWLFRDVQASAAAPAPRRKRKAS